MLIVHAALSRLIVLDEQMLIQKDGEKKKNVRGPNLSVPQHTLYTVGNENWAEVFLIK